MEGEHEQAFSIDVSRWLNKWKKKKPVSTKLTGAKEVDFFSRINGECIPHSRDALHQFHQPPVEIQLSGSDFALFQMQEKCIKRSPLDYLEPHRECGTNVHEYDFVVKRGVLLDLALALYNRQQSFEIHAVKLDSEEPVYMAHRKFNPNCKKRTPRKKQQNSVSNKPRQSTKNSMTVKKLSQLKKKKKKNAIDENTTVDELRHYWAARFETLCTGREDIDIETKFYSILKRFVGHHHLLLTAEIDCELSGTSKPPSRYAELKCRYEAKHDFHFVNKYMKYWLQSYLAGVRTIMEGVRNDQGMLLRVEQIETNKLPKLCRKQYKTLRVGWSETKILAFLEHVLDNIADACAANTGTTIRVRYNCDEMTLSGDVLEADNFGFLMADAVSRVDEHVMSNVEESSESEGTVHHLAVDTSTNEAWSFWKMIQTFLSFVQTRIRCYFR